MDICCSSKTEPLGRAYQRGHKIPEHMGKERPFGVIVGAKVRPFKLALTPTWHTASHNQQSASAPSVATAVGPAKATLTPITRCC